MRTCRVIAAGLIAFTLLIQLGSIAHVAFVPHVTCAEHGELIELTADAAPADIGPLDQLRSVASQSRHDHCAVAAFHQQPMRTRARLATMAAVAPPSVLARAMESAAPAHPVALLDLAPKIPPPA